MTNFTEGGNTPRQGGWLTLTRISNAPLVGVPASAELITCAVHWIGGRSTPCPGADCPACETYGSRLYGFLGFNPNEQRSLSRVVVEIPGANVNEVTSALRSAQADNFQELWSFSRARPRGRVTFRVGTPGGLPEVRLVQEWEVHRCLAAIWSMPEPPTESTNLDEWINRMRAAARGQLVDRMTDASVREFDQAAAREAGRS